MNKPKILLVDDDEAVHDFMLAKLGARYTLVSTTEPDQVLALALKEKPDLIVCDIDMPRMDGGDISAAIYNDDQIRQIPLLFLSALLPASQGQAAGQIGGRPAISKHAPVGELIARIDSLIAH
jgi:CheY-like chemotaxis protein